MTHIHGSMSWVEFVQLQTLRCLFFDFPATTSLRYVHHRLVCLLVLLGCDLTVVRPDDWHLRHPRRDANNRSQQKGPLVSRHDWSATTLWYARTSIKIDAAAEVTISKCNLRKSSTHELTWNAGWFYQDHASLRNATLWHSINSFRVKTEKWR